MRHLAIKRSIERVPGGMMVVPLLTGAIINTLSSAKIAASSAGTR